MDKKFLDDVLQMNNAALVKAIIAKSQYGAIELYICEVDKAKEAFAEQRVMVDELLKRLKC